MAPNKAKTKFQSLGSLAGGLKKLGSLYIEKARLKTTEKVAILLSSIAFSAIVVAIGLVFLVFVSIGIGHLLATTIAPHLAYLIVAGFYLVILVLAVLLRRRLFVDPITRFMSRLLVDEPEYELVRTDNTQSADTKPEDTESDKSDKDYDDMARHIAELIQKADAEAGSEGGES